MTWIKALAVCGLLVLAVVVIYGQTAQHEFIVCDDDPYVFGNPYVVTGLTGTTWLGHDRLPCGQLASADLDVAHARREPLRHSLRETEDAKSSAAWKGPQAWKGPEAGGHHLTSVALHAASAVVLFLVFWQMTGEFWLSALVAAMFAVHPLRVESVAWAAERKDVLSGLFWMLTLLAYGWYARRPDVRRYMAVVGLFALGLTAKSMLVTLPCVLLLLDFWPLRVAGRHVRCPVPREHDCPRRFPPRSLGWLVVEKLPLFAPSRPRSASS